MLIRTVRRTKAGEGPGRRVIEVRKAMLVRCRPARRVVIS